MYVYNIMYIIITLVAGRFLLRAFPFPPPPSFILIIILINQWKVKLKGTGW